MLPKLKDFFSTLKTYLLCALLVIIFASLAIMGLWSQSSKVSQSKAYLIQNQIAQNQNSPSLINQLKEAITNGDQPQVSELINKIQKNTSSSNQQLASEQAKSINDTQLVTIFGIEMPSIIIYIFGLLAFLSLIALLFIIHKSVKQKNNETNLLPANTQQALMDFLEIIQALAEGDLTVQAHVSEDITGTLADSFNYSVEELRNLVTMVSQSTRKLSEAVGDSSSVAEVLLNASTEQARQITEASDTVIHVTEAMIDVSDQTSSAVDIAMSSTEAARSGSERVKLTISGMDQIRDHIQETSKRIKRLGESSQEIGDIVELINDIADQTHILALNASIQAAAAGDAGRGFAVVADEIQRLAERTGNATRQVENIVKTIQNDTHEAMFAMEKSTGEVVNGANLAERAGESLNEIESVSTKLASMIQNASKSSREVSTLSTRMKESIDSIKKLTDQNVTSTQITNRSVEKINSLTDELRKSISGFKIK